jgi:hypothetical protein
VIVKLLNDCGCYEDGHCYCTSSYSSPAECCPDCDASCYCSTTYPCTYWHSSSTDSDSHYERPSAPSNLHNDWPCHASPAYRYREASDREAGARVSVQRFGHQKADGVSAKNFLINIQKAFLSERPFH